MNARLQIRLKVMVAVSAVSLLMSCASDPKPTREQISNARFGPAPSAQEVDAAVRQFAKVVDPAFHDEASDFLMLPFRSYEPFKGYLYVRDRAGGGRHEFGWLVNVYFGGDRSIMSCCSSGMGALSTTSFPWRAKSAPWSDRPVVRIRNGRHRSPFRHRSPSGFHAHTGWAADGRNAAAERFQAETLEVTPVTRFQNGVHGRDCGTRHRVGRVDAHEGKEIGSPRSLDCWLASLSRTHFLPS